MVSELLNGAALLVLDGFWYDVLCVEIARTLERELERTEWEVSYEFCIFKVLVFNFSEGSSDSD